MSRSRVALVATVLVAAAAAGAWIRNGASPDGTTTPTTEPSATRSTAASHVRRARLEPTDGQADAETYPPSAEEPGSPDPVVHGGTIAGVVVDDLGAPVEGAAIAIRARGKVMTAASRADGTFEFAGVVGGEHELDALCVGHFGTRQSVEVDGKQLRVVLARVARVRFQLRMPPGSANEVGVWWGFFDEGGTQRAEHAVLVRLDQLDMDVVAPIDTRRMRIDVRDFVPVWREVQFVTGATCDLGEIAIDAGTTLIGRVTGPDGRTPPKVRIHVWDAAKKEILAARYPAADGSFSIPGTPRAPVLVEFEAEDFVPVERRIDATVAGEALAISMVRGALVTVHVLGADGKDPDWCGVDVLDTNRAPTGLKLRSMSMMTTHTGRLPAGRYLIVASREEGESAERVVDLTEGGSEDITLRLSK